MTPEAVVAVGEVARLIRVIIEDIPAERRIEAWERWFRFWEPFWKAVGLELPK